MNRDIVFKIWDRKNKLWISAGDLKMSDNGVVGVMNVFRGVYATFPDEDIVYFTGKQDTSGKNIYSGDIMDNDCVVCYDIHLAKWKAVPFGMYITNAGNGGWTGYDLYNHIGTVIGNVFENPELSR